VEQRRHRRVGEPPAALAPHDAGRLEVAVEEPDRLQLPERVGNLLKERERVGGREPLATVEPSERLALDEVAPEHEVARDDADEEQSGDPAGKIPLPVDEGPADSQRSRRAGAGNELDGNHSR